MITQRPVCVPEEVVALRDIPGLTYWQSSDGLGGGSCLLEAAIHGLCELIERDASALWSFKTAAEVLAREIDATSFNCASLIGLAEPNPIGWSCAFASLT